MRAVIGEYENDGFSLPDEVWKLIAASLVTRQYPPGKILLSEGEMSDKLYFMVEGVARGYHLSKNKEYTNWFARNGQFACSVRSFFKQTPSFETIELLTQSTLLYVSHSDIQRGLAKLPEVGHLIHLLTEKHLLLYESRSRTMRCLNAAERLRHFIKHNPELYREVALKHVASYLDMDICTLSRLRAKPDKAPNP